MPMMDHIQGRIAFVKAEVKITDAQASAWDAFADTLRLQAKRIGSQIEMRARRLAHVDCAGMAGR